MKQNYASLFSSLKKSIVIFAIGTTTLANAQVATSYVFSQSSGTFTPITGGTVVGAIGSGWDDASFAAQPIGFTFLYNGTNYTEFGVNCNGFIIMGNGPVVNTYCGAQGVTATNNHNMIAGYGTDMIPISLTSGEIRYETIGIAPNRQLVVQWINVHHYPGGPTGDDYSFQIILNETTNMVQVVFGTFLSVTVMGPNTCTDAANESGSVGLIGNLPADFNLRALTNGTDTWPTSVTATLLSDVCNLSPTNVPSSGLKYSWSLPPVDMAATTLVVPTANMCYTSTETVTVRIQNFGSQTIDFSVDPVIVSCSVTGPTSATFGPLLLSSGTLAPSMTQDVVMSTTCDMSLTGTYTFTASTNTPSDGNPINDNMTPINIDYGVAAMSSDTICVAATATLTLSGFSGPLQWQSWDGSSWVNETGPGNNATPYSVSPIATTDYRVMFCGSVVSNILTLVVVNPVPPVTTGDTRCGYGTVNLSAAGVGNMVWYTQPTGGTPLFTGTNYSPTVSATDTFYVESTIGSASAGPVTTTFAGGNGQLGNMFNITALQSVSITHFDGHMATGTADWSVWYRPGSFIGFETDSTQWIFLGTAVGVVAQGTGNPTPIPLLFNVPIPAGQTYGFYVTAHSGTVAYTNGTTLDAVYVQDANIQVREGKGNAYFGASFSPRIWNGKVYYSSGCASASRTPVIATVTPAIPVSVSASQTVICGLPASTTVTLSASSANPSYSYTWTGADLVSTTGPVVTAIPNATTTYIVTGDDGTCADTTAITIILTAPPPAVATAAPSSICLGSPATLSTPAGPVTYSVNSIPYAPIGFVGNPGPAGDNVLSGATPIGFTFKFFGTDFTTFNMSTNGNIQFGPTYSTSGVPAIIPAVAVPNNYIGAPWANLTTVIGGSIQWASMGVAPNRMLVVEYSNVSFNTGGGTHTSQIILYETTNCIEVHAGLVDNTTLNKTMGIENSTGTSGYAPPGRNMGNWNFTTSEAWSFCPVSAYTFVWNPATWLNNPNISNPTLSAAAIGSYTYDVTVTDVSSGCTSTDTVSVSVLAIPTAPSTVGDSRCGFGVVNLSAIGTGDMVWYSQPTGGAPLFTGPIYSPSIGATTTYYVESSVGNASANLTTTFAGGNGSSGNMFDITALSNVTITHFDAHVATGTHNFEIWYRPGTYFGFQNDSSTWIHLGTATGVVAAGTGVPTVVPITFAVAIPAGQSYGFYVTSTTGTVTYTNGTAVGNVYVQDANIQVREGHGGAYFNLINNPRVFNGNVYYESGCASANRTPVTATVTPADTIIATPASNPMCVGTPVTITIASINSSYSYSWTPTTNISNPTEDTVTANPSSTTLYTINALDTAGCATSTTVNLVVNPVPSVAATADPIVVCAGSPVQLDINNTSPPLEFTVGTGTLVNTPTTWPAPYGNWYWGAHQQMLVKASELTASGLAAGNITSLAFYVVSNAGTPTYTSFDISMKLVSMPSITVFDGSGGFTLVYSSPITVTPTTWNSHAFTTPFYWDGTSDVLIDMCSFNNAPFTTNAIFYHSTTPYASVVVRHIDGSNAACSDFAFVNQNPTRRPNMKFGQASSSSYVWTPNIALSSDTIVNPVASPTSNTTYTVSVTDNFWNCTSTSSISITVNPLPVVTFSPPGNLCIDASPLPLSGGAPTGGVYTGTGVVSNIFYPTLAGLGTHTIYYTYTDNQGCAGTDSVLLTVNDLPVVTLPTFADACVSTYPVTLSTGTPIGGTYSGTGVSAGIFDPSVAGAGIHAITYTYTDANGCTNSAFRNIVIHDSPVANAGPDVNGNNTITGASASGGTPPYTYMWSPCLDMTGCNTLTPFANPQVNTYYVLYVIDANGCYSTDTVLVTSTIGIAPIQIESSGLLVYPNPAAGMFNILFLSPNDKADVTVINSIGQEVYRSGVFTAPTLPYQVNLTGQPDGIYIMHVKYQDRIITSRLVLNK